MFADLPGRSGYNKRLRKLGDTRSWLIGMLGADTSIATDDVWVIDSTPAGYCASHSRFVWGLRLHLVCTLHGLLREENFSLQGNAKTIDGGLQSLCPQHHWLPRLHFGDGPHLFVGREAPK